MKPLFVLKPCLSKELSQYDCSFGHPKQMLKLIDKKLFKSLRFKILLISRIVKRIRRNNFTCIVLQPHSINLNEKIFPEHKHAIHSATIETQLIVSILGHEPTTGNQIIHIHTKGLFF